MSVADVSEETLQEVAECLDDFPFSKRRDSDPEQYWYSLANAIRKSKKVGGQFDLYTSHVCILLLKSWQISLGQIYMNTCTWGECLQSRYRMGHGWS